LRISSAKVLEIKAGKRPRRGGREGRREGRRGVRVLVEGRRVRRRMRR